MVEKGRITCRQLEITGRVRITIGFKDNGGTGHVGFYAYQLLINLFQNTSVLSL